MRGTCQAASMLAALGVTAALACGTSGGDAQTTSSTEPPIGPPGATATAPAVMPPTPPPPTDAGVDSPAVGPPIQRLLYVTNDATGALDIFDIDAGHKLVRSVQLPMGHRFRGISGSVADGMLFLTDGDAFAAMGFDLLTDKTVWHFTYAQNDCNFPDRMSVSLDGSTLYMPCKYAQKVKLMHAKTGIYIKDLTNITQDAHNSFTGESGKYMYMSARSGGPLYLVDPATNNVTKTLGPFSSPVRPFSVNPDETYLYANLTNLLGFAVVDINTGRITEVVQTTPSARTQIPSARAPDSHGDNPKSHGLAVRPGGKEVWFLDDAYGYLYVYDITTMPPTHLADVPLFTDITKAWGYDQNRWLAFDADGQYAYPSDGSVVDAKARAVIPGVHITPSEKLLEVDFQNGKPIRIGGQNGGVYK